MLQKTNMKSYYILDTSVLLYDPKSLFSFKNAHVVIPETVLKELDRKKNLSSVVGKHARTAIRQLKDLSDKGQKNGEDIITGITSDDLKVTVSIFSENLPDIPKGLNPEESDNKILSVAVTFKDKNPGSDVFLVTKDTSLELKAQVHHILTDDYSSKSRAHDSGYTGFFVDEKPRSSTVAKIYESGEIRLPKKYSECVSENGFVVMKPPKKAQGSKDVLLQQKGNKLKMCDDRYRLQAYRIKPLNHEQYFAMSLMMDPDVKLVTLNGAAGTGKTLLALAAGLCQIDEGSGRPYKKVMFARSLMPLGGKEQIGFLKGSLEDKLAPWVRPISDNINYVIKSPPDPTTGGSPYDLYQHYVNEGLLEIEALQYIRGRSLVDTFLIIDECQNITRNEVYTIITRVGEGSKVILLGDNLQVDAPYLSRNDNALVHVIESFKGSKIAGHVTLMESVRSELAQEAAERLVL